MKKPKSKLEKAKKRFIEMWGDSVCEFGDFWNEENRPKFTRQLNNLIRLAKEEGRMGK